MNRTAIVSLAVVCMSVCGCDFLRGLAGRPSGEEIERKRAAIELSLREKEQARLDSLRAAERVEADSLAALSRLDELGMKMMRLSELGGAEGGMPSGYALVVGSFKSEKNARGMALAVSDAGYPAEVLKFRNGMSAVTVAPCSRLADMAAACGKVKLEKFCPEDAWVLSNN